ncbi:F-box/FBD/LRR-repeat protein At5g56420-like [Argentina anserina]|uniref:F-box/FBD/LRR-repeat protein At5g56420-like n=1 Tax=Argentina anserina TaxID=57926 RepID=UPI00217648FC|nr:F-box/FBD/LRR-repeat protein At5g56420-like [Potentilla anserina]XP_050369655.1 F-box/FBD/LRR-repeat protein At5g56420-like [Potentilla anserina]XP_050369656.1 F-box/FBD/LRR-repeat protein At5g56420-like [Potentilla anserina]XP_050369657.1 F-box/FBD/LRR-repeat protein At5g56420-like [Potentilla anserina]XP_050369658.1 F-box/FBD/LRR-repeat protein At5g56420-like [Potentilla anserina]
MASESKHQEEADEDRISILPDDVLCHILSLLDTHEAVHTTILSKRWNNFWTSLPNLKLCDRYFPKSHSQQKHKSESDPFMTFVDHVMRLRDSKDIRKFSLSCMHRELQFMPKDAYRIHCWIGAAIEHNIVELDISLVGCNGMNFPLPHSLYTCTTLVVLKLESNCISYDPPITGCFPRLKLLVVSFTNPDSPDSVRRLFSCCPVLEDLAIYGYPGRDNLAVTISASELKTLKIHLGCNEYYLSDPAYTFIIDAPKLENFSLKDPWFRSNYQFENGNSVLKANIVLNDSEEDDPKDFADRTSALLGRISNVEQLYFSAAFLEDFHMSTLESLHHLELSLGGCNYWDLLVEFLKKSPNLNHLVLINSGCEPNFKDEVERNLVTPAVSPNCLLSSLETISIKQFKGQRDEMEVAEYLLKNGEVLNKMKIYIMNPRYSGVHTKEELSNTLLRYEKGSKTCQVEVIYDENWTKYTNVILFSDMGKSGEECQWPSNVRLIKVVK